MTDLGFHSLAHLAHLYVTKPDPVIRRNLNVNRIISDHHAGEYLERLPSEWQVQWKADGSDSGRV